MRNFFKRIFAEDNLIIAIPGIVVVLLIVAFMIYGFSQPVSSKISEVDNLLQTQIKQENIMINEYESAEFTKESPYIKVNPYGISPMTALIMFETETTDSFKVIIKGKTVEADLEFISRETNLHKIPVYGLYEGTNNVEIYDYSQVDSQVGDLVFATSIEITIDEEDLLKLPDASIDTTYDYFQDDFMILSPATANLPVGYDFNGDIRWYFNIPLGFGPEVLENGHLMLGTDRIISDPYYTTGIYEMDFLGKIYKEYYIPGGFHHDLVELDNGNLLVLSNDFNGTVEDIVVELDRESGEVIKTWDIADYIPTTEGMAQMWTSDDWFHNNSIDFDPVNNSIILSGRHQDAVISIGYDSGELNWIIGDPANWDTPGLADTYFFTPVGTSFEWQYAQHSALVLPDGNIFIFDNGNNKTKDSETYVLADMSYSRGVIYDINTDTMEISQVFQYGKSLGSDFYSPYISNVEYYEDNHYMIHSGGIAYSSETGPLNIPAPLYNDGGTVYENSITVELLNNEVVYEMRVSGNYYRAKRVSMYNDTTNFSIEQGIALGNQEITTTHPENVTGSFTLFKTLPQKYEFTLEKQTDRLKVEGVFNRYDTIYLVLVGKNDNLTYNIPTSRTAYTAMCSSVFQGDERFISFYVNEEEISGEYRVPLFRQHPAHFTQVIQ